MENLIDQILMDLHNAVRGLQSDLEQTDNALTEAAKTICNYDDMMFADEFDKEFADGLVDDIKKKLLEVANDNN